VGGWAKRLHFASRAVMDSVLHPYDLGSTQWYVLYVLVNDGPTTQRDLARLLDVERATLSGVVAALVRKGLVDQATDRADQRRRVLSITGAGRRLWEALPDPTALILTLAFSDADPVELETARRVLQAAVERLNDHLSKGTGK
jgi:MarR family transcriptional regulator, lower aerobic nicotinate degradation pathway regulator